ncbi:Ethanolamine-phosphate phospho-lyase [Amphibalanus amphitrite]|uniref:Ethanolamine-phosphate phospho-lyase n=1 Tax=Amphibalanus amphitrite TaxID=1232801 RepID=A0A6A4W1Q7_AMPAM|nr:Ethanolamine-phosphate phospho-lyase [Amphibalanus amphitrite]
MTVPGIVIPPPGWLRKIHDYMHSLGALVISDEMCTALGRNGKSFWGFQGENGDPDFICCGKPIGDVRGEGLLIGVDIVTVSDRKPDRQACQCVVYRLKEEERIIAASEGEHLNVLYITPPLCFSEENARSLVAALDRVLTYMEENGTDINFSSLGASLLEPETEPVDLATYEDVD